MDFGHAALLIVAVVGIVELVGLLFPKVKDDKRLLTAVVLVTSIAVVFLVADSVWAHEQVIGDKPLDQLNVASELLVAVLLAGVASATKLGINAVTNIGENQPK